MDRDKNRRQDQHTEINSESKEIYESEMDTQHITEMYTESKLIPDTEIDIDGQLDTSQKQGVMDTNEGMDTLDGQVGWTK